MSSKIERYKSTGTPLPETYDAWQVYGAGFENVGREGKPVTLPLREPKDNEILIRIDALGLCLSDIKIINQGEQHPRLKGRDLKNDPTVLGHECAATVVKVGKQWQEQFRPGQRFIVQADIYVNGETMAFGYRIPGGLAEYAYLDERALDGDEGCYLLPVQPDTGYSQSALSEPWACVEMSYNLDDRLEPACGSMLIVTDSPDRWKSVYPDALITSRDPGCFPTGQFDDIIVTEPTPELVQRLADASMPKEGNLYLVGAPTQMGPVSLDIGRIHYDGLRFYGGGADVDAIAKANSRFDLMPQGSALFIGAGGPMGQMHVQRAIEIPCGARLVVVTDLDRSRLEHIQHRFGDLARNKGVELVTLSPETFDSPDAMNEKIRSLSPNGYTDICVLAPVPALVAQAMGFAADHGLVNVFAGIPIGNPATLELGDLCRGVKLIGSSGSRIGDLRKILDMAESGDLNTDLSVAAIGGLNAAREGLEGVKSGRFPGKTVIYTQIPDLPLMGLDEIPEKLPELAKHLGPGGSWTQEAELALLEMFL